MPALDWSYLKDLRFKMQSSIVEKQPDLWNYGSVNSRPAANVVKQGAYIQMIFCSYFHRIKA